MSACTENLCERAGVSGSEFRIVKITYRPVIDRNESRTADISGDQVIICSGTGNQHSFGQNADGVDHRAVRKLLVFQPRSEEHTSELQSLMRISYAVFCLKKKKKK